MITDVWEERALGSATPHPKGLGPTSQKFLGPLCMPIQFELERPYFAWWSN